jgi:hypothetical protein
VPRADDDHFVMLHELATRHLMVALTGTFI